MWLPEFDYLQLSDWVVELVFRVLRRIWIVPIAVLALDFAITGLGDQFTMFPLRYVSADVLGLFLGVGNS